MLDWLARTGGVAVAYFVVGKLALLLAIPPGYATAVWPSAGVALAGILLFGFRVWPGIVVGAFLVNLPITLGSDPELVLPAVILPLVIAAGSTAQAATGALLLRRSVGFPHTFDHPTDILKAMVLCGPVSCVIGATVGVAALLLSGSIGSDAWVANWTTWWMGDTIGVLVAIPLVAAWETDFRQARLRTRVSVAIPIVVGMLLTTILFLDVRKTELRRAQSEFERRADIMAAALQQSVESNLDIVRSIVNLFDTFQHVERQEFRAFVTPVFAQHPGLHGLSWNAVIPRHQRAEYERAARREGFSGFEITERDPGQGLVRARHRDEYVVVYYIEPHEPNRQALGFDLSSDPVRAEILRRARDSGSVQATPPVTLVQESGEQSGCLFFAPIYRPDMAVETLEQRRRHIVSFVSGVFRTGEMVDEALQAFDNEGIGYRIVDRSDPADARPLNLGEPAPPEDAAATDALQWTKVIDVAGRRWAIEFTSTAGFPAWRPTGRPWAVATGGLLFTALLGAFLLAVAGRAAAIERVVVSRTAELSQTNLSLEQEIAEREHAQAELRRAHDELEQRVAARTAEIVRATEKLQQEIHERQRLETELLRAQKLESIGILAGGIAHDFNNLLTAISGNLALARLELDRQGSTLPYLEQAQRALSRATSLTHQLLTFSKGGAPVKKTIDLSGLLRESCDFALRGSNVRCDFELPPDLWPAEVDGGQINQVVSNLVINAMQAMPAGGRIRIRARNVQAEPGELPMLEPGRYLELRFEDEGADIAPENRSRVFDPYFTTKPGGSGLGLATAYSIIRKHGGVIELESEPGNGSTFRVYLPAAEGPPRAEAVGAELDHPSRSARVLVMDDEEMIRKLAGTIIRQAGFEVELAGDGAEAVARFRRAAEAGRPFDAVILDLTVPGGMGGKDAIRQLRRIEPDVRAIVSSGYSEDPVLSRYREHGFRGVVVKPYTIQELRETLRRVLED